MANRNFIFIISSFCTFMNLWFFIILHIYEFTILSLFSLLPLHCNKALLWFCYIGGEMMICVVVLLSYSRRGVSQERRYKMLLSFSPLWTGFIDFYLVIVVSISCRGDSQGRDLFYYSRSPLCFLLCCCFLVFGFYLFSMSGRFTGRRNVVNSRSPSLNRNSNFEF